MRSSQANRGNRFFVTTLNTKFITLKKPGTAECKKGGPSSQSGPIWRLVFNSIGEYRVTAVVRWGSHVNSRQIAFRDQGRDLEQRLPPPAPEDSPKAQGHATHCSFIVAGIKISFMFS